MTDSRDGCNCKIGRVTAEYEISDAGARLVERWRGGTSVRRLTENLNKDIVESELDAANVGQVQWSRSPVYEALHTAELNEAEEIEIRRELDRIGIDVEKLSSDLVSHQTVYRHLTRCLGASKGDDPTPEERLETARDTVHALQQRTEIVTESTIGSLRSADIIDLGDIEVLVDIHVVCSDCGRSMDFATAIGDGCTCDTS